MSNRIRNILNAGPYRRIFVVSVILERYKFKSESFRLANRNCLLVVRLQQLFGIIVRCFVIVLPSDTSMTNELNYDSRGADGKTEKNFLHFEWILPVSSVHHWDLWFISSERVLVVTISWFDRVSRRERLFKLDEILFTCGILLFGNR